MTVEPCHQQRDWIRSVVEQFEGRLLRYAQHATGDAERGRDVVQDTFLTLCGQRQEDIEGHVAEWLFTVCRNRAMDVRRKENRMKTTSVERTAAEPSREPTQAETSELHDSAEQVFRMMNGLSNNQQEVLRLKFQGGLSYKEIASVTQLSVSNVGYLLHTALSSLRKELGVT